MNLPEHLQAQVPAMDARLAEIDREIAYYVTRAALHEDQMRVAKARLDGARKRLAVLGAERSRIATWELFSNEKDESKQVKSTEDTAG